MACSGEHRTFAVVQFVNGESVVATQRTFRRHFSLSAHDPAPTEKQYAVGFQQLTKIIGIEQNIRPSKNTNSTKKRHSCGRLN